MHLVCPQCSLAWPRSRTGSAELIDETIVLKALGIEPLEFPK
jgi:hypothetical protein